MMLCNWYYYDLILPNEVMTIHDNWCVKQVVVLFSILFSIVCYYCNDSDIFVCLCPYYVMMCVIIEMQWKIIDIGMMTLNGSSDIIVLFDQIRYLKCDRVFCIGILLMMMMVFIGKCNDWNCLHWWPETVPWILMWWYIVRLVLLVLMMMMMWLCYHVCIWCLPVYDPVLWLILTLFHFTLMMVLLLFDVVFLLMTNMY